ncbi:threonine/serine exporter family protein [Thermoanaerobacterium thermosaccharolyticum]|uniref:threonine/serine exporter family protein n=1 Tax=Thermoanaerobacterium thermosaccharolyticum TaxID=1517 RepID=UPI001785B924|nr:threonine/serine exporter family protein [Thermoanaerobacterium thermosaccharolyticum]MBE0069162.1 threonine/serine exporter [Thermoanaerobacterium thermosaccharolyticum]MBE0228985.1 threonine/serine exporter [Thermoanaerobacterium thermosaccharolyticum]
MILQILYGFFATAGFAFLFNVPFDAIVVSGLSGAIGWAGYLLSMKIYPSIVAASFIASLFIGIMGEIFAQKKKYPTTIFVIPGIIPLVPGAYSYKTVLAIIQGNNKQAFDLGLQTIGIALAIAAGLMFVISFSRIKKR